MMKEQRAALLEESLRVFLMNNEVVGTFQPGARGKQALGLLVVLGLLCLCLIVGMLWVVGKRLLTGA